MSAFDSVELKYAARLLKENCAMGMLICDDCPFNIPDSDDNCLINTGASPAYWPIDKESE